MRAAANRVASGHDGRTARRALGLDVEVGQPHTFGSELVNARCRRAPKNAATVRANFAVAKVVHQDEDDVGLLVGCVRWSDCAKQRQRENERGGDEVLFVCGFHCCFFPLIDLLISR